MSTVAADQIWGTSKQAAEIVGVHPVTIRQWSKKGAIRVRSVPGTMTRFSLADARRLADDAAGRRKPEFEGNA